MVLNGLKVKNAIKFMYFMYFLTTNDHLTPTRPHALCNHVGKVTCDVGGSSNPVFTK